MTVSELVEVLPSGLRINFWMRKSMDIYMGAKTSSDNKYPSEDIPDRKVVEVHITSLNSVYVAYV